MPSHGRPCRCGAGRGRRTETGAMALFWAMTKHLGLTQAPDFTRCQYGLWHWTTKGTP